MTIGSSIERWSAGAVALAVATLGLLGAPARTVASPSPKPLKTVAVPAFVAPPGWHHAQGTSDGLGTWLRPGDTGYSENITVEAKDGVGSLDSLFTAEMAYIRGFPDVFGYAPTDTTVCGNHPAKYVSYTYTSPTGLPVTSEVVIAVSERRGIRRVTASRFRKMPTPRRNDRC